MLDIIVVTVLSVGLVGFLIALVVVKVKHDTAFLAESTSRADDLIAKARQWRKPVPASLPVQSIPTPAIQPVP